MLGVRNLFHGTKFLLNPLKRLGSYRSLYVLFDEEYTVPQYCNLNIKCLYNVHIKPLDALVYLDNDRLKVSVKSSSNFSKPNIKCKIDYNDITIIDETNRIPEDYTCEIELPVKANINVTTDRCVTVENLHGDVIDLKAENGDIILEKCHSKNISAICNKGNITCRGVIQASDINLKTAKNGSIMVGRMQGINLKMETENGDIKVLSSYCDNSIYETQKGKLNLQNAHKNNKILIHNEGSLTMVGLDGKIEATIKKGNIDMQVARILENSSVTLLENGKIVLKLSESVQEDTVLEVVSKYFVIDKNINLRLEREGDKYVLSPSNLEEDKSYNLLRVDCKNSNVTLESANWSEMFKLAVEGKN